MSLTKAKIAENVYNNVQFNKVDVADIVDNLFDLMKFTLANGENIKISCFGNFEIQNKASRPGRNPQTGESLQVSARRIVVFKPSLKLRGRINGGE